MLRVVIFILEDAELSTNVEKVDTYPTP